MVFGDDIGQSFDPFTHNSTRRVRVSHATNALAVLSHNARRAVHGDEHISRSFQPTWLEIMG